MDRFAAMLIFFGVGLVLLLLLLALFAAAPILCSILISLFYTLYLFLAHEDAGVHHAQEFENRFWTIFALLSSTAIFFARDSPICLGLWSPSLGFLAVIASGYAIHALDRHLHRLEISREHGLHPLRRAGTANTSLVRLNSLGVPVEDQLAKITSCLNEIDQIFIPSTINNFLNERYISKKEREIISVFEEAEPKALNYLITHVKLGLVFYKVKDHRSFGGLHRTELIELLAVDRLPVLTVLARVVVLHALQIMKLPANARSECWVRHIILKTHQDDLSELKTLTDAKGNYFCMNKLIFTDIRSETVRRDILAHIKKEAAIQSAHMKMGSKRAKERSKRAWRKILSDVDDTLTCSGGSYPAGIDKRFGRKVAYPGVLSFYRELDLGCVKDGPEEWPPNTPGNLVFLSARPHLYKDFSEKQNFAKFLKLREKGMHCIPSLLAGDMASGSAFILSDDMEPLAQKKFENFQKYASIYPEFSHVFIGDNGQGDVRAGELMHERFPHLLEALYIHIVGDIQKTHGFAPERWRKKGLRPCFFRTYPDAAIDAATRKPPLIRLSGLRRICEDAVRDFLLIQPKQWPSPEHLYSRREELNQGLWRANKILARHSLEPVPLIPNTAIWKIGQKVRSPFGIGTILSFNPIFDLYEIELDWRQLDIQLADHKLYEAKMKSDADYASSKGKRKAEAVSTLETVVETSEVDDELCDVASTLGVESSFLQTTSCSVVTPLDINASDHQRVEYSSSTGRLNVADNETVAARTVSTSSSTPSSSPAVISSDFSIGEHHIDDSESLAHLTEWTADSNTSLGSCSSVTTSQSFSADSDVQGSFYNSTVDLLKPVQTEPRDIQDDQTLKFELREAKNNPFETKHANRLVVATIQGRYLTKYIAPKLPVFSKEIERRGSRFTFWNVEPKLEIEVKKTKFSAGQQLITPYGLATVKEDRIGDIVVVKMHGFNATGYLNKSSVKLEGKNFLNAFLRQLSMKDSQSIKESQEPKTPQTPKKKRSDVLIAPGTVLRTPFGEGIVQLEDSIERQTERKAPAKVSGDHEKFSKSINKIELPVNKNIVTVPISLSSWVLRNGKHPVLYSPPEIALKWKNLEFEGKALLSVFGSLVSKTMRRMTSVSSVAPAAVPIATASIEPTTFDRYFKDGAAVTTIFGDGRVKTFRQADGIYEVELLRWTLDKRSMVTAYCCKESLGYRMAKGCHEGYPVLTSLGLTGTLASVEPTTGIHVVTCTCGLGGNTVCYLQPENVICPIKAAIGESVVTPFGEGIIRKYRHKDTMYAIALHDCHATIYARAENFDRIDAKEGREGPPQINWFWRFLFYNTEDNKSGTVCSQRSRSNSVASRKSSRSQTSK